jgi:predicted metal-dependent hydrolase
VQHLENYPAEYLKGIDLFNSGQFHAAHDAWEERWLTDIGTDEKLFLQGLIQSSVAFYHLDTGKTDAARQMYIRAKEKFLRLNRAIFMSLDLDQYQSDLDANLSWLLEPTGTIPKINAPIIRLLPFNQENL